MQYFVEAADPKKTDEPDYRSDLHFFQKTDTDYRYRFSDTRILFFKIETYHIATILLETCNRKQHMSF